MANTINFVGYSRASGRDPYLRVYSVSFSGSYTINYGEVLNFAGALNPDGIEDAQFPNVAPPPIDPFVLGSTTGGWKPELQIGGSGTVGEFGINFYNGTTQLTAETYESAGFPANGSNFGEVLIGIFQSY
jgi:hypothetical protein